MKSVVVLLGLAILGTTSLGCNKDSKAPAVLTPQVTQLDPLGPSRDRRPVLSGVADPGATVELFVNDYRCQSKADAATTADAKTGQFTIQLSEDLPLDLTVELTLRATLGDRESECTDPLEYQVDWTPPALLGLQSRRSAGESYFLQGSTGETGLTVLVYSKPDCSGEPVAQGVTDAQGEFEVKVSVPEEATELRVILQDQATNRSECPGFGLGVRP